MAPRGLKLEEFSDRELIFRISDLEDDEGWVSTEDFLAAVKIDHTNPKQCVGVRFAWMKRYGVLEKDPKTTEARWRLTEAGQAVINAGLTKGQQNALEAIAPEQGMEAVSRIAALAATNRGSAYGHLMGRAWRGTMTPRQRRNGNGRNGAARRGGR